MHKLGIFLILTTESKMVLNCTKLSSAKKTSGIAVTYRAGLGNEYGTCPSSCALMPACKSGTKKIDTEYLNALINAVPKGGYAFTFSHFHFKFYSKLLKAGKTLINYSADSWSAVKAAVDAGADTVHMVKESFWTSSKKNKTVDGIRVVRCPAEYLEDISCSNCGGIDGPLCARFNRGYVIGFTMHGSKKKLAESDSAGGCYAGNFPVSKHWADLSRRDSNAATEESDADHITRFAAGLPPRSILRHHVAGDIGLVT